MNHIPWVNLVLELSSSAPSIDEEDNKKYDTKAVVNIQDQLSRKYGSKRTRR